MWKLILLWIAIQSAPPAWAGTLGQPVADQPRAATAANRTHSEPEFQTARLGNPFQIPMVQPLRLSDPQGLGQSALKRSGQPHPAVVRVIVPEQGAISYGSGTLVDVRNQFGLVITNWHVVRDAQGDVEVVFPDGFRSKARALKVDADWDLAALVIWRPSVPPVTLAASAPRPGDPLTICGYGQGRYRALTGTCTQYYAPKENLPQQMVELDVEARQGDSGGPIFNQQGQLAGVLFGAGQGTTLGSFGGRVQSFLATLAPDIGQRADDVLLQAESTQHGAGATQGGLTHGKPAVGDLAHSGNTNWDTPHGESPNQGRLGPATYPTHSMASQFADENRYQKENRDVWKSTEQSRSPYAEVTDTDQSAQRKGDATEEGDTWRAVTGVGWYEQAKSGLAVIGLLAIVAGVLRAVR